MSEATNMIMLANGREVTFEEFSSWGGHKQKMSLFPSNKGRIFGEDFKNKVREGRKRSIELGRTKIILGGDHFAARKVRTPKGDFDSLKNAANAYSIDGGTMRTWIKKNKEGFLFLDAPLSRKPARIKGGLSGSKNKSSRAILTPEGRFETIKEAAAFFGLSKGAFSNELKKPNSLFKYVDNKVSQRIFKILNQRQVITPLGRFSSINSAANHYGMSSEGMRYRLNSKNWSDFYFVLDEEKLKENI